MTIGQTAAERAGVAGGSGVATVTVKGHVIRLVGDMQAFRAAAVGRVLERAEDGEPAALAWLERHGVTFVSLRGGS